jgi:adenine/guanine phosphoribosyltransferase-like PRPP-binding protein
MAEIPMAVNVIATKSTSTVSAAVSSADYPSVMLGNILVFATNYEKLFVIVGVAITALTLLWALFGNPSILALVKRLIGSNKPKYDLRMPKFGDASTRKVVSVKSKELDEAVDSFAATVKNVDLIIGIQPSGTQLAHRLAQKLSTELGHVHKKYVNVETTPFFVFSEKSLKRSLRHSIVELNLPTLKQEPRSIIVVDAVTTFGNALQKGAVLLRKRFPRSDIKFYVYASDSTRLAAANAGIFERTTCSVNIDNFEVWLKFPWEVTS